MGKGDKRSRRGKIFAGSYGKARPKKKASFKQPEEEVKVTKTRAKKKAE